MLRNYSENMTKYQFQYFLCCIKLAVKQKYEVKSRATTLVIKIMKLLAFYHSSNTVKKLDINLYKKGLLENSDFYYFLLYLNLISLAFFLHYITAVALCLLFETTEGLLEFPNTHCNFSNVISTSLYMLDMTPFETRS